MKTIKYCAAALLIIASAISCTKELQEVPAITNEGDAITFAAVLPSTKVSVASDGKAGWEAGDQIAVSDGTTTEVVTLKSEDIKETYALLNTTTLSSAAAGYYAVYPASAKSGEVSGGNVTISYGAAQTNGANKAAVAACAAGNTTFSFKNTGCLLAFTTDYEFDSVEFAGAAGENIAFGTYTVNATTGEFVSSDGAAGKVTLALEPGKTNYIALPGNGASLASGFTMSFKKGETVCGTLSSDKALALKRNTLYNLGNISSKMSVDEYSLYNAGAAIEIAGCKYDKATYGDAILLTAAEAGTDLRQYIHDKTGVFFLEANKDCYFSSVTSAQTQITKNVILVSRYSDKPVKYVPKKYHQLRKNAIFAVKNVVIDCNSLTEAYFCNFAAANDGGPLARLHFDGCEFYFGTSKQLAYSTNQTLFESFRMYNCYVETLKTNARLALIAVSTNPYLDKIKEIDIYNNIFYDPNNAGALAFFEGSMTAPSSGNAQQTDISIRQNTIWGLAGSNVYFQVNGAKSLTVDKNIFYYPASATGHSFILKTNTAATVECNFGDNVSYSSTKKTTYFTHSNSLFKLATGNSIANAGTDPMTSADPSKGDFTPVAAYKGYGAQR